MFLIWGLGICFILLSSTMASSKIDAPLVEILNKGETARVQISMTDSNASLQQDLANREYADRTERLETQHRELTEFATHSQASVINVLEKAKERIPFTYESLWITNQIIVSGADLQLVNDIAAIANVAKIEGEKFVQLLI